MLWDAAGCPWMTWDALESSGFLLNSWRYEEIFEIYCSVRMLFVFAEPLGCSRMPQGARGCSRMPYHA